MTAPTIVVVPAAGMPSSIYQPFVSALENHEFPVKFVEYPFMEKDAPKLPDNLLDITATRNIVKNLVDDGSNVVVFMNSYGGTVGTSALQGLGKEGQAKAGKEGGVVRLVYAAAFVFREGEMMPGKGDWEALKQLGTYDEKTDKLTMSKEACMRVLFSDLEPAEAERCSHRMVPANVSAMWAPQRPDEAWWHIPSTLIYCTVDRGIPLAFQEQMVNNVKEVQPTAFDVTSTLEAGHAPIVSKVDELVGILKNAAGL